MVPEIAAEAPITGACSPGWRGQVRGRARRRRHREENQKARRAEAACHRAAEWQEPDGVETIMRPVGMQQRVGDEGPDLRAASRRAARRRSTIEES